MMPADVTSRALAYALIAATLAAAPLRAQGVPPKVEVAAPPAIVTGRILGPDKKAIEEAEVLYGSDLRTLTDRRGRFTFDPAPDGVRDVLVRKIGFTPVRFSVTVHAGDVWDGTVRMQRAVQSLAEVVVLDTAALRNYRPQWIDDFLERRRAGLGTFLDRIDIERAHALNTGKLVATAPGVLSRSGFGWDELNVNRCGSGFGTNSKGIVFVDGVQILNSWQVQAATGASLIVEGTPGAF